MAEKRKLSSEEAVKNGMLPNNDEQMANGEYRYRRMHEDGSGYIRTVAGPEGAWQNSHYHTGVREFIAVQKGWMAFVRMIKRVDLPAHASLQIVREGESIISEPNVSHNIYMPAGAVTHCVKFGDAGAEKVSGKADWHADTDLDDIVKQMSEGELLKVDGYAIFYLNKW